MLCIVPLSVGAAPHSQQEGQPPFLSRSAFRTLGIRDGLRSNSVTSLLTDSHGYLWVGTAQGVNRYDGHEVRIRFPETDDEQLHELFNNPVTSMEEDADGRIWMECESGSYFLYDTRTARFSATATELLNGLGIGCKGNYKVKVGRKGTLWVLTEAAASRYDCHTGDLKTWDVRLPMPGKTADVVAEVADGLYLSAEHAVWHFNSSTGELQREELPESMQHSMGEHSLLADADGTLWVYSTREEHVCRYIVGEHGGFGEQCHQGHDGRRAWQHLDSHRPSGRVCL